MNKAKNNTHSFDIDDACKYGVEEAVLLHLLRIWYENNEANQQNFFKGRYWIRMPVHRMIRYFPYWQGKPTENEEKRIKQEKSAHRKLYRLLESLVSQGVLMVDRFDAVVTSQTRYYTLANLAVDEVEVGRTMPAQQIMDALLQSTQQPDNFDDSEPINSPSDETVISEVTNLSIGSDETVTSEQNVELTKTSNPIDKNVTQIVYKQDSKTNKEEVNNSLPAGNTHEEQAGRQATPSNDFLQPGEVHPAVARNRQNIGRYQPQLNGDVDWCTIDSRTHTKQQLYDKLHYLHAGEKGDVFRRECPGDFELHVLNFIQLKAMNYNFRHDNGLSTIFRRYTQDVLEEARQQARPTRPAKPNNYEVTLDD